MNTIEASYNHCQRLARRAASNFYFSFLLLPRAKRRAMCALYAYLRKVDDLSDQEGVDAAESRRALENLRAKLMAGSRRQAAGSAKQQDESDLILPALCDTIERFQIPVEYLTAAIDGVEMDLDGAEYHTFDELETYCYRVASVVGLACIHIWGFRGTEAIELARRCGIAFQLTNILRDLKEDAERGRVYLPAEDWKRFGYTVEELKRGEINSRFSPFIQFQIDRAKTYYRAADELEPLLSYDGRRAFRAMCQTYRGLLDKIEHQPSAIVAHRVRLSRWKKCGIALRAIFSRPSSCAATPPAASVPSRETAAS